MDRGQNRPQFWPKSTILVHCPHLNQTQNANQNWNNSIITKLATTWHYWQYEHGHILDLDHHLIKWIEPYSWSWFRDSVNWLLSLLFSSLAFFFRWSILTEIGLDEVRILWPTRMIRCDQAINSLRPSDYAFCVEFGFQNITGGCRLLMLGIRCRFLKLLKKPYVAIHGEPWRSTTI